MCPRSLSHKFWYIPTYHRLYSSQIRDFKKFMFSSNKKAKMLNNINQHLKHLKKSTQRLWDGDNIQIIGQACIIVSVGSTL